MKSINYKLGTYEMAREYPQYRYESYEGGEDKECCACQKPATHHVRIAWSYMRGEDEFEPVCKRHFKMAENQEGRFIAHMLTKEKHFSEEAQ